MARSRQPGADARAFMARLMPTQPMLSRRALIARRACRARAMPSVAKMNAPTSGMPASRAATAGLCLTERTMTYWASQLTAAAAAASTASASIALRSQPCAWSPARRAAGAPGMPLGCAGAGGVLSPADAGGPWGSRTCQLATVARLGLARGRAGREVLRRGQRGVETSSSTWLSAAGHRASWRSRVSTLAVIRVTGRCISWSSAASLAESYVLSRATSY